jgi:AAA domain
MLVVNILGAKGGVGTSTTAAMIAVSLATTGAHVVMVDYTGTGDVSAIVTNGSLTIRTDMPTRVEAETIDFVVVDHKAKPRNDHYETSRTGHINILVATNCYLAVQRVISTPVVVHGLVVRRDPQRILTVNDIHAVTAIGPARTLVINDDPRIARLVDAGLIGVSNRLICRLQLARFVHQIAEYETLKRQLKANGEANANANVAA